MKPDYKLVAKAKYIHANADLASEIWHEVYKRYYPAKQLDTLVETLQSADAIEADIDNDVNYFLVVLGGKTIGYFAWKMENTSLHLMHLYLKPEYRGKTLYDVLYANGVVNKFPNDEMQKVNAHAIKDDSNDEAEACGF